MIANRGYNTASRGFYDYFASVFTTETSFDPLKTPDETFCGHEIETLTDIILESDEIRVNCPKLRADK